MIQNPINFWKVAAVLGPIHKDMWCVCVRVCVYACVCIWLLRKSGLIIEALTLKIWAIVLCQCWCKQIISKLYSTFIKVVENVANFRQSWEKVELESWNRRSGKSVSITTKKSLSNISKSINYCEAQANTLWISSSVLSFFIALFYYCELFGFIWCFVLGDFFAYIYCVVMKLRPSWEYFSLPQPGFERKFIRARQFEATYIIVPITGWIWARHSGLIFQSIFLY